MHKPLHRLIGLLPTLALLLVVLCHATSQPLEPYLTDSAQKSGQPPDQVQDPGQDHGNPTVVIHTLALTWHIPSSTIQGGLSNRTLLRCRTSGGIRAPPAWV